MTDNERERESKKVLDAIGQIDPDLIAEAEPKQAEAKATAEEVIKLPFFRRHIYAIAMAACAVLIVAGAIVLGVLLNKPKDNSGTDIAMAGTEVDSTAPAPKSTAAAAASTVPAAKSDDAAEDKGVSILVPDHEAFVPPREDTGMHYKVDKSEGIPSVVEVAPGVERPDVAPGADTPPVDPAMPTEDGRDMFGLLTAGRWNDNANWGFFKNLVTTGKIAFPAYGLDPIAKTAVTVKNAAGEAVQGIKVEAIYSDDEATVWTAVTNDEGVAYIFLPAVENRTWKVRAYDAAGKVVYTGTDDYAFSGKKEEGVPDSQARTTGHPEMLDLTVDTASYTYKDTQVMFILDTTGSMGDELTYLQGEFGHIMEQVTASGVSYSWNFYRDEGDDYVTKTNGFSTDLAALRKLLNNESADGGGDTPEAVAEILTETMNSTAWNADSKKLAFLIFDAPPHDEKAAAVAAAIAKAAERGIHVVPVVASNADRETELFGRALAILTDGEYVFLTDDSGIGGSHLEPIIGDYEVEKLGDVIVDIINKFAVK
ncbi:MAG: VWA domain-containing protein [Lachnospiraceae bacterium]|nr:VWA domain-containing protein [Lachnospiraceae bacterium]